MKTMTREEFDSLRVGDEVMGDKDGCGYIGLVIARTSSRVDVQMSYGIEQLKFEDIPKVFEDFGLFKKKELKEHKHIREYKSTYGVGDRIVLQNTANERSIIGKVIHVSIVPMSEMDIISTNVHVRYAPLHINGQASSFQGYTVGYTVMVEGCSYYNHPHYVLIPEGTEIYLTENVIASLEQDYANHLAKIRKKESSALCQSEKSSSQPATNAERCLSYGRARRKR